MGKLRSAAAVVSAAMTLGGGALIGLGATASAATTFTDTSVSVTAQPVILDQVAALTDPVVTPVTPGPPLVAGSVQFTTSSTGLAWTISNSNGFSIDQAGLLTIRTVGTATAPVVTVVTAKDARGASRTATVSVNVAGAVSVINDTSSFAVTAANNGDGTVSLAPGTYTYAVNMPGFAISGTVLSATGVVPDPYVLTMTATAADGSLALETLGVRVKGVAATVTATGTGTATATAIGTATAMPTVTPVASVPAVVAPGAIPSGGVGTGGGTSSGDSLLALVIGSMLVLSGGGALAAAGMSRRQR